MAVTGSAETTPSARHRREAAVVLAACALLGGVTHGWIAVALPGLLAVGALKWAHRVVVSRFMGTSVTAGSAVLIASFLPQDWLVAESSELGALAARIGYGLVLAAAIRLYLARTKNGVEPTVLLVLAAAVACGQQKSGLVYPILLGALLLCVIIALRASPDGGPLWFALGPRRKRLTLAAVVAAVVFSAGTMGALPVLHARVVKAIYGWDRRGSSTGFSDQILMGGAADINESDVLVLRVHGRRPDYLRGVVFNRYKNGRWIPGESDLGHRVALPSTGQLGTTSSRLVPVKLGPRFFLPKGARDVSTPGGEALVDRMGLLRAMPGSSADTVWFTYTDRGDFDVQPPNEEDRHLPSGWEGKLTELATAWTKGIENDRDQLTAIENRLRTQYRYSLKHERRTNADPIVDFLLVNPVGHCEYFASAMAMLGRAVGIPTRVASGFRVLEYNAVGNFHVVRERDAHSWVEAYVQGQWVTFDPTPSSALIRPASTPWMTAWVEWAGDRWHGVNAAVLRAALFGVLGTGTGGTALVLFLLRLRSRWRDKRATRPRARPVPGMKKLFASLAAQGWTRSPSETLESFARRLRGDIEPSDNLDVAAELIEHYARFLYGGIGSAATLEGQVTEWTGGRSER